MEKYLRISSARVQRSKGKWTSSASFRCPNLDRLLPGAYVVHTLQCLSRPSSVGLILVVVSVTALSSRIAFGLLLGKIHPDKEMKKWYTVVLNSMEPKYAVET